MKLKFNEIFIVVSIVMISKSSYPLCYDPGGRDFASERYSVQVTGTPSHMYFGRMISSSKLKIFPG